VVADCGEIGEARPQDRVDRGEEIVGVERVVKVALVQHQIGTFVFDQPQDGLEAGAIIGVANKGDLEVGVGRYQLGGPALGFWSSATISTALGLVPHAASVSHRMLTIALSTGVFTARRIVRFLGDIGGCE
jgi:hypothetical protein